MTVSENDWVEIDKLLAGSDLEANAFAELRRRLPHLSWTRCDASDVTEPPFRVYEKFEIHLLDSADHCAQITSDPARATGIVLAQRTVRP